eukprot:gene25452-31086_t
MIKNYKLYSITVKEELKQYTLMLQVWTIILLQKVKINETVISHDIKLVKIGHDVIQQEIKKSQEQPDGITNNG